ncbi:MAG: glycosyltransferase [Ardenticatenales bacterium]
MSAPPPERATGPRRPSIVCLAFSPIARDARVLRQARALATLGDVVVYGYGPRADDGRDLGGGARFAAIGAPSRGGIVDRLAKAALLVLGRIAPRRWRGALYHRWYWRYELYMRARIALVAHAPDVIVANDWNALPVAIEAGRALGAGVVVDLHEFAPRQFENRPFWRIFVAPAIDRLLADHLPRTNAAITVGDALAEAYASRYGVRPVVVLNAPARRDAPLSSPTPTDPHTIRLVHHGVAARGRHLETMLEAVAAAGDRFTLDLVLVPTDVAYIAELTALAARRAPTRITVRPPVAPDDIVAMLAGYDVGIFVLPPTTFNHANAMPNKLFDFIAAGLAVCVGPSPAMADLVRRHGCGVVADGFDAAATARCLAALTGEAIDRYKAASRVAAASLNAETEAETLRDVVAGVLAAHPLGRRPDEAAALDDGG